MPSAALAVALATSDTACKSGFSWKKSEKVERAADGRSDNSFRFAPGPSIVN